MLEFLHSVLECKKFEDDNSRKVVPVINGMAPLLSILVIFFTSENSAGIFKQSMRLGTE
jgi:hypothetical protein